MRAGRETASPREPTGPPASCALAPAVPSMAPTARAIRPRPATTLDARPPTGQFSCRDMRDTPSFPSANPPLRPPRHDPWAAAGCGTRAPRAWSRVLASLALSVAGTAAACVNTTDLSPPDADADLADDAVFCTGSICSAVCRAVGQPSGDCRGPVCQCGDPATCAAGEVRPCYSGPIGTAGLGVCRLGQATCRGMLGEFPDWGPCAGDVLPTSETCNGDDDDCDLRTDEDAGCP